MAANAHKRAATAAESKLASSVEKLTVAINQIAANSPGGNGYQLRNEILIESDKERVRYENGRTIDGYAAKRLFEDAKRVANHRRTLARNIDRDAGQARPASVCAHHIVASQDSRAHESRKIIFGWGIGINDVDNGVYLPRFKNIVVPSMPNAPLHGPIHTARYHANVLFRLGFAHADDGHGGRAILRDIKDDLINGSFPWSEA